MLTGFFWSEWDRSRTLRPLEPHSKRATNLRYTRMYLSLMPNDNTILDWLFKR